MNDGAVELMIATVMVIVVAHCPAAGVNVYVVVAVLLMAGDQVPVIPSVELEGSTTLPPVQTAGICVKDGVTGLTPEPEAATDTAAAPPPVTGIFPSYDWAAVGVNTTNIFVDASTPPGWAIVNVLVYVPDALVENL